MDIDKISKLSKDKRPVNQLSVEELEDILAYRKSDHSEKLLEAALSYRKAYNDLVSFIFDALKNREFECSETEDIREFIISCLDNIEEDRDRKLELLQKCYPLVYMLLWTGNVWNDHNFQKNPIQYIKKCLTAEKLDTADKGNILLMKISSSLEAPHKNLKLINSKSKE